MYLWQKAFNGILAEFVLTKKKEKYSDMLNIKALVGIRIVFMGKEFE